MVDAAHATPPYRFAVTVNLRLADSMSYVIELRRFDKCLREDARLCIVVVVSDVRWE